MGDKNWEESLRARKSISAKCGHVKRKIHEEESLTGGLLEFALGVIEESRPGFSDNDFLNKLSTKLRTGGKLGEYEEHIMVDVLLLHKRLGA